MSAPNDEPPPPTYDASSESLRRQSQPTDGVDPAIQYSRRKGSLATDLAVSPSRSAFPAEQSPMSGNGQEWNDGQLRPPPGAPYPGQQPLMRMQNRSTPSLPSHQSGPHQQVPPVPPLNHDPAAELGHFSSMSIHDPADRSSTSLSYRSAQDPIQRSGSAMSYRSYNSYEPIPRAGSSMSMGTQRRMGPPPSRSATMLPPHPHAHPSWGHPPGPRGPPPPHMAGPGPYDPSIYPPDGQGGRPYPPSIRSSGYDGSEGTLESGDVDPSNSSIRSGGGRPPGAPPPMNGYPPRYPPPHMGGPPYPGGPPPHPGYPRPPGPPRGPPLPPPPQIYASEYNPLYAAATDVLGLGPPPGSHPIPPSVSAPHLAGPGPYPPPGPPGPMGPPNGVGLAPYSPQGANLARGPSTASSLLSSDSGGSRPSLQRAATTVSNLSSLSTKKTKAIDVNSPPYTKEYVEQYRHRLKGDPDPESHFAFAKYLIEAAKRIGADASESEQRTMRKYRESLIQDALKVVRKLATQGETYAEAQFFLANCHGTGMLGLQVDHEKAYHLYYQAAKQEHPAACYRVAVCNEIAAGTKKDLRRAVAFYQKAASLGDTAAMYKLGTILLQGSLGEPPSPKEAVQWLKLAAEQADEENPHALYSLAMLHERPDNAVVVYDEIYAKDLYTKAGLLGHVPSQLRLGACYEYGSLGCPQDPRRSIAWYTKAAEKGDSEAELSLSGWYLTGSDGVLKQSDSEAYLWARRAANKGLSKAEFAVGYYAEVGIGVKQDMDLAKRWYMRAAAQGNKRAMHRLTELKREGNKRLNTARPTRQQAADEGCVIM